MKGWVIREHGEPDTMRFTTLPVPDLRPGQVRVAIRAAGINHLDTWVRRGVPGHTFPLPIVPGADGAGVVDAVGSGVANVVLDDEVVVLPGVSCGLCAHCLSGDDHLCRDYGILGESRDGTCADTVVVPAQNVAPKPRGLDFAEAASVPLVFLTAWTMLDKAGLAPGETVLVQAGGSGVGSAAVQIARLRGARVIATAGTPAKVQRALDLGADYAIDYRSEDFVAGVRHITGKAGVDVVFEHVGGEVFENSLRCLAAGGRLVTCGATAGADVQINLRRLFFKNLALIGDKMGPKRHLLTVLKLFDLGRLRPVLAERLPFDRLPDAHRLLEGRRVFGKVVVEKV